MMGWERATWRALHRFGDGRQCTQRTQRGGGGPKRRRDGGPKGWEGDLARCVRCRVFREKQQRRWCPPGKGRACLLRGSRRTRRVTAVRLRHIRLTHRRSARPSLRHLTRLPCLARLARLVHRHERRRVVVVVAAARAAAAVAVVCTAVVGRHLEARAARAAAQQPKERREQQHTRNAARHHRRAQVFVSPDPGGGAVALATHWLATCRRHQRRWRLRREARWRRGLRRPLRYVARGDGRRR